MIKTSAQEVLGSRKGLYFGHQQFLDTVFEWNGELERRTKENKNLTSPPRLFRSTRKAAIATSEEWQGNGKQVYLRSQQQQLQAEKRPATKEA
jgi:hypothetical protein